MTELCDGDKIKEEGGHRGQKCGNKAEGEYAEMMEQSKRADESRC